MPALYGFTGNNANVSVSNTTGLYIGSGNVNVFNNAQTLYNLLVPSSTIAWQLVNSNQDVSGYVIPGCDLTVGNLTLTSNLIVNGANLYVAGSSDPVIFGQINTSATTIPLGTSVAAGTNPIFSFTLPSIGLWEVTYVVDGTTTLGSTSGLNYYTNAFLTDSGGNVLVDSTVTVADLAFSFNNGAYYAPGSSISGTGTGIYIINAQSANLTYKVGTSSTGGTINANNTKVIYKLLNPEFFISNIPYANTITAGSITTGNILTNNYLFANGQSIFNSIGPGSYGNTQVAAYLAVGNDPTINAINANVTAANAAIVKVQGNLTSFETYANATFSTGTYSNTNVTALLSSGIVSTNIVTTANVNAANVNATGTFFGNLIAANVLVANIGIQQYTTYNTVSAPGYSKGVLWYDNVQDSIAYYNSVTNNEVNVGQELQFNVYNSTGSTINQGVPVYLSGGGVGTAPNVAPAIANTVATSQVAGVANQAIPAGTVGSVVTVGLVANVSMGSFSVGDTLYLSPYSAGQVQNTQPPTGFVVKVGTVIYNNSPNGIFLVNKTVPVNNQYFGNLTLTGNLSANNASITNQLTAGNIATAGALTAGNLITTSGVYWANGVSYGSSFAGTYSNANVASYLPVYSGNIQANYISLLGGGIASNSRVGAVSLGNLTFADTGIMASFQNNTNNYTYVAIQNTNSGATATSDYAAYNDQASYMDMGINSSGYSGSGNFSLPGAGYIYTGNTDISIGTYSANAIHFITNNATTDAMSIWANGNVTTGNITNTGVITATGNITAPNFLGTAQYFAGDLHGNILYDSVNLRANIQAYPQNYLNSNSWSIFQTSGNITTQNPGSPVYTTYNGVPTITTPGSVAGVFQNNVVYATKSGTTQVLSSMSVQGIYSPANVTMNGADRVRHTNMAAELQMRGQTWGTYTYYGGSGVPAGSSAAPMVGSFSGAMVASGYGNVNQITGGYLAAYIAPSSTTAMNSNFVTGMQLSPSYAPWTNYAQPASYIDIARCLNLTSGRGNTTTGVQNITNLYGIHTIKNWENNGTAGFKILNVKRVIQNEDPDTDIYSAGNLIIGGNIIQTGTNAVSFSGPTTISSNLTISGSNSLMKVTTYTVSALNAITGSTGQFAAVSNGTAKNGGQMAYWDTTNNRWSWFDTNLAVS